MFPAPSEPIRLHAALHEFAVLGRHARRLAEKTSATDSIGLPGVLSAIACDLTGDAGLRERDRCASPDRFRRYVVYPPPSQVAGQLAAISAALNSTVDRPRAFDAMIVLVAITNCHPFDDGNGRVSRILANWLLGDRSITSCLYLPLREIAQFSRGGFIIRVRQAELYDDWLPLARFLFASMKLWKALTSRAAFSQHAAIAYGIADNVCEPDRNQVGN